MIPRSCDSSKNLKYNPTPNNYHHALGVQIINLTTTTKYILKQKNIKLKQLTPNLCMPGETGGGAAAPVAGETIVIFFARTVILVSSVA
ncbi:hypothetical protein Hanom_Chr16g01443171 [Helianthus anomalus]